LTVASGAWIEMHDQIERSIAGDLMPVRALASKAAEHMGRIAGVFTLIDDPAQRPSVTTRCNARRS